MAKTTKKKKEKGFTLDGEDTVIDFIPKKVRNKLKGKEKKLIVVVPADLHRRLKVLSAQTGQSMKAIVVHTLKTTIPPISEILEQYSKPKKKTKSS